MAKLVFDVGRVHDRRDGYRLIAMALFSFASALLEPTWNGPVASEFVLSPERHELRMSDEPRAPEC
jgi:hypothetical protein